MARRPTPITEITKQYLDYPPEIGDLPDLPATGATRRAALVVLKGPECDIGTFRWVDDPVFIGRDPMAELPIDDLRISRRHCLVLEFDGRYYVEDLGSTNGTQLNRRPFRGRVPIESGDKIFFGDTVVKFIYDDDPEMTFYRRMDLLATVDDLTGLVQRRRFDALLMRALAAAHVRKANLGVLMLDLDRVKVINDAHGHEMGGQVIADAGHRLGEIVSTAGAACRLGGDEFIAFLRNHALAETLQLARQVRRAIASGTTERDGVVVSTTVSIGVAVFPADARSTEGLRRRADEALYRAKQAGGNRVST